MKRLMMIFLTLMLCTALICPVLAEGSVSIALSESSLVIGTGGKVKLEVATESTEKLKYTWESTDKKIASVDAKGTVAGVKPGEATITCSAVLGKEVVATAACTVTVYTSVKTVKMKAPDKTLFVNKPVQMEVTVTPDDAAYQKLVWSSSDESVATVDENGVVTAHLPGKVKITCATDQPNQPKAITADAQFTVKQPVEAIEADATAVVLWLADTVPDQPDTAEINIEVLPENADNRKVNWITSDKNITEVKNGKITAKKAGGCLVTVMAADGAGTRADIDVIVLSPYTYKINADALKDAGVAFTADEVKAAETAAAIVQAAQDRLAETENESRSIMLNHFVRAAAANGKAFLTGTADDEAVPVTVVMYDDQGNCALLSYDPVWGTVYFSAARSINETFTQVPVDASAFTPADGQ